MRTKDMSEFNIQKLAPSRWLAKAGLLSPFSLRITLKKKASESLAYSITQWVAK